MPITCLCPQCQKTLAIGEEFAGQPMRCPLCMALFQSPALPAAAGAAVGRGPAAPPPPPAPPPPAPPPPWVPSSPAAASPPPPPASTPPPQSPGWAPAPNSVVSPGAGAEFNGVASTGRLAPGWHMVHRGLAVIPPSLLIVAAVLATSRIVVWLAGEQNAITDFVQLIAIPVSILGIIVAVLGAGACCLVPPNCKARLFALAAGGTLAVFLLVSLATFAIRSLLGPSTATGAAATRSALLPTGYLPAGLLALAGCILFLVFLRGVALHFQNKRLAQGVLYCALFVAGSPLLLLFIMLLLWMTLQSIGGDGTGLAILSALVAYIVAAVDLFWFLNMVKEVRHVVIRGFVSRVA